MLLVEISRTMPELARYLGGQLDSITPLIAETLYRGISPSQIREAIGSRTLDGAGNPVGALTHRLRGLIAQRPVERVERCPLPSHHGQPWNSCRCCNGEIKAGDDPFEGKADMRPKGWFAAYPKARRLVGLTVEADE